MKIKNFILCTTALFIVIGLAACKKNNTSTAGDEVEAAFELSGNEAITENMNEDAGDILMETAVENNFSGRNAGVATAQTMNNLICATVTITPGQSFPKKVSIDFGSGCTSSNGIFRKGIITLVVSDSLRKAGSVAVMNFSNYYVGGFKMEGTVTWTNTSQGAIKSWQRKCENGKITTNNGRYWLYSSIRNIIQTAGITTPGYLSDDTYSITGQHAIINAKRVSATSTIIIPLELKVLCENVDKGTLKIEGANHNALVDFGEGNCDHIATISIDGRDPRTILLR